MSNTALRASARLAPTLLVMGGVCAAFACAQSAAIPPDSSSGGSTSGSGSTGGSGSTSGSASSGSTSGGGFGGSGGNSGSTSSGSTSGGSTSGGSTSGGGSSGATGSGSGSTSGSATSSSGSSGGSTSSGSGSGTSSGSSGSTSGGGTEAGTPSICDGTGTRLLASTQTFIDDFEECAISPGWSSFNDVMPTPNAFKILQAPGGAAGTGHGGHYAGTGAKVTSAGGFGVGTVFNVAIDPADHIYCIDISQFDGVSFWAKAGAAGSTISLNFVLPQTNMQSVDSLGRPNGGDCVTNCYNHPRVPVTLTTNWALYTVRFADATGGSATVGSRLQELAWLSPDSNWDFSIDEIAFYKGTPSVGAVGPGPSTCPSDGGAGD